VTTATESFTGLQATVANATLMGVDGMTLALSGTVKFNETSRADDERVDWDSASTVPAGLLLR